MHGALGTALWFGSTWNFCVLLQLALLLSLNLRQYYIPSHTSIHCFKQFSDFRSLDYILYAFFPVHGIQVTGSLGLFEPYGAVVKNQVYGRITGVSEF